MRIIQPDFTRLVELPGVGACPRPVDIDQSLTGFSDLVSLRVYQFARDMIVHGEAEEDELFIVLLRGTVDIDVAGGSSASFTLQTDRGIGAVYLPPHDRYCLNARADADVAYARARPMDGKIRNSRSFERVDGTLAVAGYADSLSIASSVPAASDDRVLSQLGNSTGERFVHVRTVNSDTLSVAGHDMHDWQTLALARGEPCHIERARDNAAILVVAAA